MYIATSKLTVGTGHSHHPKSKFKDIVIHTSFNPQGEDTGSDGPDEEREDGEANEAAEEEERERQRRIEESLRKREEEVQRALAGHLRDRDKERMQHKHDEAVHNFNALLADLVSIYLRIKSSQQR